MAIPDAWPEFGASRVAEGVLDLLECAEDALTNIGSGAPCAAFVYTGEDRVPFDWCDSCSSGSCGAVWVRMDTAFQYDTFPFPDDGASCRGPIAYQIELGVHRCFDVGEDGRVDPEDQTDVSLRLVEDQKALMSAVVCCVSARLRGVVVQDWVPVGPDGGCVGGYWRVVLDGMA